ncbi:MAG: methyltransferase [candidate division WOR-3 bacterium]|nr:MAG: methyltransferase [candidate division WOR-3 bacterium]
MTKTYVATFIPGFSKLVRELLMYHFPDTRTSILLDGLTVFSTVSDPTRLMYFNNIFLLLHVFPTCGAQPMHEMLKYIARSKKAARTIAMNRPSPGASFRIVTSRENRLVAVDNRMLARAEKHLTAETGMKVNRSRPDIELWCLYRREGTGFFMMRLTKHATTQRMLHKGELRPELAGLLCALSEPRDSDVFVDPFCGYGSIPLARAQLAPYRTIHALDNDMHMVTYLKKKLQTRDIPYPSRSIRVGHCDALHLDTFEDNSVDKIVTDPPWGIFDAKKTNGIDLFYRDMLGECIRILKTSGILIILTAQKELLGNSVGYYSDILEIADTYHILVAGEKAAVYKCKKVNV